MDPMLGERTQVTPCAPAPVTLKTGLLLAVETTVGLIESAA